MNDRSSNSSENESPSDSDGGPKTIGFFRSSLAGVLLALSAFAVCISVGLLVLTTKGWTDKMEAVVESKAWALIPIPFAIGFAIIGIRALRRPFLELNADELLWHQRGKTEPELFPFASMEKTSLAQAGAIFEMEIHEEEDEPTAMFRIPLTGVPKSQRELLATAVEAKVREWERAQGQG